jgi:hypothetical protein
VPAIVTIGSNITVWLLAGLVFGPDFPQRFLGIKLIFFFLRGVWGRRYALAVRSHGHNVNMILIISNDSIHLGILAPINRSSTPGPPGDHLPVGFPTMSSQLLTPMISMT